jgi:hypothetical protein
VTPAARTCVTCVWRRAVPFIGISCTNGRSPLYMHDATQYDVCDLHTLHTPTAPAKAETDDA